MRKFYIIANWKSNKTLSEAEDWIEGLKIKDLELMSKEAIVCPSFTNLSILKSLIINHKSNIKLGAQDISPFDEGAFTGEVNGKQIKEFADYVIVGHSERRNNFGEDDGTVNQKLDRALKYELTPILCVSNLDQVQSSKFKVQSYSSKFKIAEIMLIAYEPLFAIGSGNPDTPENADKMAKNIKEILGEIPVLYGGSVDKNNVKSFTTMPNIDGVLVGKSSLDVKEFTQIIHNS